MKTLFDKVWDQHVVTKVAGDRDVLYIDLHLIHEVTSPQAFAELEGRNIQIRRPGQMLATADHNVPTRDQHLPIKDLLSRQQVDKLTENCQRHGIQLFGLGHPYQGIVHVIGPELGFTLPGSTIVCGDSHTSTHGAFGSIAFGIGTSQVAQVMASQCLLQLKPRVMRINIEGELREGVLAKDIILYLISRLSASGGTGYFIEYSGSAIRSLSMEERMTICNMSIEMGARGGIIAPDQVTFDYLKDKPYAPKGEKFEEAVRYWERLKTDEDARFDKELNYQAGDIKPMITYGTNPGMAIGIDERIPFYDDHSHKRSLDYMGFAAGETMVGQKIDNVFIGSCTNSRIEDLRVVAKYVKGRKKADHIRAFIVPGSQQVEKQAREEGLHQIFEEAGFELRQPGCSACLAMNDDKIPEGEYCVSTSNRNFEGRQGPGARTLLAGPLVAAAVAIHGEIIEMN